MVGKTFEMTTSGNYVLLVSSENWITTGIVNRENIEDFIKDYSETCLKQTLDNFTVSVIMYSAP